MSKSVSGRMLLNLFGAVAALAVGGTVAAEEWAPNKPVRIVVPIIGSTNDVLARLVAPGLSKALDQPVVVVNKGGAGGIIGTDEVAKSPPDGHTLLVGYNGPLAINKTLFSKLPYDPVEDLAPITLAVTTPQFLAVHPSVPAHSVAELVALAKSDPARLTYASVAMGSASHLTMEMLKTAAKVNLTHAPYKGATPAVADLLGGHVQAAFLVPGNIVHFANEGKVRLIATTGETRFKSKPDVATMIEQGFPDFVALSWIGFLAPGGTPQPIIDRYHKEITHLLQSPEIRSKLEEMEFEVVASTPKQFADWIQTEIPRWGKVIQETGTKAE